MAPRRGGGPGDTRRPQLDGLRFFLFVCVFLTHHFSEDAEYLGYALPVFFVLSGFLITKVLLTTEHPTLWGRLRTFYIRRTLRIFPAYYAVVLMLWLWGNLTYPLHYVAYVINVKIFALSLGPDVPGFMAWFDQHWRRDSLHLWSLSVEEQFYIVYPLLFYLSAPRWRTRALLLVLGGSILGRLWLMGAYPHTFYSALLPVTAEYFVWGCIFAWLMEGDALRRWPAGWLLPLSGLAIAGLVFVEFFFRLDGFFQFQTSNFQTPIAALLGVFIWSLWVVEASHPIARVMSWRPLVYLGGMSYTMYLTHLFSWDVYRALPLRLPLSDRAGLVVGTFVVTTLMSMAIWHGLERPVNGLKRYVR